MPQRELEHTFLKRAAWVGSFLFEQIFARGFEQEAVIHARRTSRFAGAATQTQINVLLIRRRTGFEAAFGDGAHQVNASARAVVFVAQLLIGRTRRQTQAAMYAAQ